MDDPLCAEFAQREILQMLYTVLPEETALVRTFPSTPPIELLYQPIRLLISASPTSPSLACSACGTTRAAVSGASAPPVFDYIH